MKDSDHKQRVLTAISHQKPDRAPIDYWARDDFTVRLMEFMQVGSVEQLHQELGIDMRPVIINENNPDFEQRTNGVLGGSSDCTGKRYIIHEDGSFEDAWGIVRRQGNDGLYEEWVGGPFVTSNDLDGFAWPRLDAFDSVETLTEQVDGYGGKYALLGQIHLPFKIAWHMRGLENFLCDMLTDVGFAGELLKRVAAYEKEKALRMVRAGADIIGTYGDIAMQDRMLVAPRAWRELEKPLLGEMIESLRAEKRGLLIFFHSDGDISEVLDDLVEIGVDIVNPIQPECMDPAEVKKRYGDHLTMHGTISLQETLPHGTTADVRNEVELRIRTCGQDGGLIICPSNMVQNDVPLENIVAMYDAAREFDG